MTERKQTVHVDLGPEGFEGAWLDLKSPWYMTQRQFNALAEQAKADQQAFLRAMVTACSLPDGELTQTDPATIDWEGVPAGVLKVVADKLTELFAETTPKALRTQPPPG